MTEGLLVVGGGPAGHSAAMAYRDTGGTGPVTLLCAEAHSPYNRPPLTKDFLRGEMDGSELSLTTDADYAAREIGVRLSSRVVGVDPAEHVVRLESGERLGYTACIWSTGSRPATLPVPGAEHPELLRLRSLDEGRRLRAAAHRAGSAIVIGSGFIGCEAAASLAVRGLDVTVISMESGPQTERLGADASDRITGWLRALGVKLLLGSDVEAIHEGHHVTLSDGSHHHAQLVLLAAGIEPCTDALTATGIALESDRVVVDEHMRSTVADLYAAGDVALAYNPAAGRRLPVEHWGEALTMGEIAGSTAAGGDAAWDSVPGFWTEINDHTLKYAAWGDGFAEARLVDHEAGSFTVWYTSEGKTVGVLTHDADEDYERGMGLIREAEPAPVD